MELKKKSYKELLNEATGRGESYQQSQAQHKAQKDSDKTIVDGKVVVSPKGAASSSKDLDSVDAKIAISNNPPKEKDNGRIKYNVDSPADDEAILKDSKTMFDGSGLPKKIVNELKINKELIGKANEQWLSERISTAIGQVSDGKQATGFIVQGYAGWGKTSCIKHVAKMYNLHIITVYLDKALPEDLGGIPSLKKVSEDDDTGYVTYNMPEWAAYMYQNQDKNFLLFFDEINQASGEVQNTLMPIVLERVICGIKFNNFIVGAAGNFSSENDYLNKMSAPLQSRFGDLYKWTKDWASATAYLEKKYANAFLTDYQAEGLAVDGVGKEKVNPITEILRWPIFKNPRELENSVLGYLIQKQKRIVTIILELDDNEELDAEDIYGIVNPNMIKTQLEHYMEGYTHDDDANYTFNIDDSNLDAASNGFSHSGFGGKGSTLLSSAQRIAAIEDIIKYFTGYFTYLLENGDAVTGGFTKKGLGNINGTTSNMSPVSGVTATAYITIAQTIRDGVPANEVLDLIKEEEGGIEGFSKSLGMDQEITQEMINNIVRNGNLKEDKNNTEYWDGFSGWALPGFKGFKKVD